MTDAVYDIVGGAGTMVDNELAVFALVDVLAVFVASGTEGKPTGNIDHVAMTIGQAIADGAHRLRGTRGGAVH